MLDTAPAPSATAPRSGFELPPRFAQRSALGFTLWVVALAFFIWSLQGTNASLRELIQGFPQMLRLAGEMVPPSTERLLPIAKALLETFQMALVGTVAGVLLSVPIAIMATKHLSPHPWAYKAARLLVAFFRTVPDLIWALLFVVSVGLGPFAGTLAIVVDKIGFCGRFFAEAMEEADRGPQEALTAIGTSKFHMIFCSVMPQVLPSFINTSLFSLEKATRSSVILGLVGAGGIGIELKVAMDLFNYAEASTIILAIFVLVLLVERFSAWLRAKVL
ncbi:MAG: phosphonate ABC transporter, permease protein PhnE [Brachymonas sp.]|nr:phosphonate ABC transporter, permease protein PhnE [Brachymonas sp.]